MAAMSSYDCMVKHSAVERRGVQWPGSLPASGEQMDGTVVNSDGEGAVGDSISHFAERWPATS